MAVLLRKRLRDERSGSLGKDLLFELRETVFRFVPSENFVELLSTAQRMNDAHLALLVVVIAEDLTRAGDENFILSQSLCSVPPLSDSVGQNDTERERVDEQNVFASAVSDEPLRQRDTDTETLFAIRVAVLKEVVANLLVGESFERLCNIYPVVVD